VIPVVFDVNPDGNLVTCTVVASAKVGARRANPRVALTIDTDTYPPRVQLIRGAATVEIVDGVPPESIRASAKLVPAADLPGWVAGVRVLYQQIARITIEPDWAKLLDFEATVPRAVADLIAAQGDPR
jgi:hypothetical protein